MPSGGEAMDDSERAAVPGGGAPPTRRSRPRLGEVLEAEALVGYLECAKQRGTLVPYRDRITVPNGFGEERFELVRVAQGVRWQRTR